MTARHDREEVRAFLDDDFRQVWAVDRNTGEPRYLEEGQALVVRAQAKAEWRCPVPGCLVEITTVSGNRRHHFRHNQPAPHPSDGESEAHLAAKAMLAEWASARLPDGASVREEETVKDPATSMHRIADVMVTWPNGDKTAFEVEYKPYTPDAWRTKQTDYDSKSVPCAWLLGHTKVKPARQRSHALGDCSNLVKVPALGAAFAADGRHILVVNPVTKQVGTLAGDRDFTERVTRFAGEAWLALDAIDECHLDPVLGLVTPTMRRIDAAVAAREEARRREEAAMRLAAERRAAQAAREKAEAARKQERWAQIEAKNQAAWDNSALKEQANTRWGTGLPDLLAKPARDTWGIHALPVHWHTALYLNHIDDKPTGHRFTITDCYATLAREGIDKNWDTKKAFKALINYLNSLQQAGLITIHRSEQGFVAGIETTGTTIDDLVRPAKERQPERPTPPLSPISAFLTRKQSAEKRRHAVDAQWEVQQERLRNIDAVKTQQAERWSTSDIHRLVADVHGGEIPAAIAWPGGSFLTAVDASPAHWHAHIYMRHVHGQPAGTPLDARVAAETLRSAGIDLPGQTSAVLAAIDDYLYNLTQRGILSRPGGDPLASGYIVVTDALRQNHPAPSPRPPSPDEPQQLTMW